ncbi:MAG: FadR/GntR family transcriptional regulator [Rhodothalassiaceae bacterium]
MSASPSTASSATAPLRARWQRGAARSASSTIVEQILDALHRGDLAPGDFLGTEAELADAFSVSRLPVRDAIRMLTAFGLLDVRVGKDGGAFVADPEPERLARAMAVQLKLMAVDFEQLLDAQKVLECHLARAAAENRSDDDLARLQEILDALVTAPPDGDTAVGLGMAFHAALADAAGNPVLSLMLKALLHILHDHYAPTSTPDRTRDVAAAHHRLLTLVAARDADGAAAHIAAHIEATRRYGPRRSHQQAE